MEQYFGHITVIVSLSALLYLALILCEHHFGVRIASGFRKYIDDRALAAVRKLEIGIAYMTNVYKKGSDAVEHDLIDPIAEPIIETHKKYDEMKTGKVRVKKKSIKKISPHLRTLFEKKSSVKKRSSR